ncbi:EFR1 family ferrodoxin [Clostridium fungisolvens]|uniref:Ferredoxin n=1 Tax=Clostridium fungisolvens TaxID=1604897 RepID=A0A6V8SFF0_9CLOT|nr:EFR1 family ferrodoxin [Clostridium fungisolvens]GFP75521.1 hypothetical protein bsdtw1_01605 [Clostridium fungisolvens]
MIFYFTGTGNSGYVASEIAKANNDTITSISKLINEEKELEFTLKDGEVIGIIYPIYAYAPPKMVMEFIKNIKFNNYKNNYVFSLATCGGDAGNAMELIKKELNNKGMTLNSGFSIIMPNNEIIHGNVDSKEVEIRKLQNVKNEIKNINTLIKARRQNISELEKGLISKFLTNAMNPIFQIFFKTDVLKFYETDDCISCGKCEKVCNSNIITLVKGKPQWNGECCQCLACINYCPKKAIQYGKSTVKKGRYTNPYFK